MIILMKIKYETVHECLKNIKQTLLRYYFNVGKKAKDFNNTFYKANASNIGFVLI